MPDPRLGPFADWTSTPLTGDASSRRYARLTGPDGVTAILMDAAGESATAFQAFQTIAAHLTGIGLAAPHIHFVNDAERLLVIDDLGPKQVAEWLTLLPLDATHLYSAAIDVLIRVQSAPPPSGLVALTPTRAAGMITPLFDWYVAQPDARAVAQITGSLQSVLSEHAPIAETLALRDFHAENLIWRADRQGTDRVGLLDFQDAVLAPPEYDLVSLLRDARRDVDDRLRQNMMARFADLSGRDLQKVQAACAVLGVQRNLRIMGIFTRLARQDGKTRYLDLLPRVWAQVVDDLSHPALDDLRAMILQSVPSPEAAKLAAT